MMKVEASYFDQLEDLVSPTVYQNISKMREIVTLDDPLLITVWRHENLRSFGDKVRAHRNPLFVSEPAGNWR